MTLHEIEETLATLSSRHAGFDEEMLVTLLLAGGWDSKDIEEAKLLFKGKTSSSLTDSPVRSLPEHVQPVLLEPEIGPDHELLEHNPIAEPTEPVSLLSETETGAKEDLPHNLPLRPFETSEHIWPFSRYRDVFYGEEASDTPPPKKAEPLPTLQPVPEVKNRETKEETLASSPEPYKIQPITFRPDSFPKKTKVVSVSKGEDKLVITASIMLFAILLLLSYMYSNGRL